MSDPQIPDILMKIFNMSRGHPLTLHELVEMLQRKGCFQELSHAKAVNRVNQILCEDRNEAYYPFQEFVVRGETCWGLKTWLPSPIPRRSRFTVSRDPLRKGTLIQHTVSPDGQELAEGRFPLQHERCAQLGNSMEDRQRVLNSVPLQCYGSQLLVCSLEEEENCIMGSALKQWYRENRVESGDILWLSVETVRPLLLRLYTEWDRDSDVYRRHIQQRAGTVSLSTDLSIRELIYFFLIRNQRIAHRNEIVEAVLASRPEVSAHSIDSCLANNDYLFVRTGKRSFWALKEWNVTPVKILIPLPKDNPLEAPDRTRPLKQVDLDYVLITIQSEDLVYRVLRATQRAMSYSEISERIAQYLLLAPILLRRTTFLDPGDERIVKLDDGTFMLREQVDQVIADLRKQMLDFKTQLEHAEEKHALESSAWRRELANAVAQAQHASEELESVRSSALADRRAVRTELEQMQNKRDSDYRNVVALQASLAQAQSALATTRTALGTAELTNTRLRQEIEQANLQLQETDNQAAALRQSLDDRKTEIVLLQQELERQRNETNTAAEGQHMALAASARVSKERNQVREKLILLQAEHDAQSKNWKEFFGRRRVRIAWDILRRQFPWSEQENPKWQ